MDSIRYGLYNMSSRAKPESTISCIGLETDWDVIRSSLSAGLNLRFILNQEGAVELGTNQAS